MVWIINRLLEVFCWKLDPPMGEAAVVTVAVSSIDVALFTIVQQPDSFPCTQKTTFLGETSFSSASLLFGGMLVPYPYTALSLKLTSKQKNQLISHPSYAAATTWMQGNSSTCRRHTPSFPLQRVPLTFRISDLSCIANFPPSYDTPYPVVTADLLFQR